MSVTAINQKQTGALLVEVVVSLFVMAVGLLGALAIQVNSQQSNQRATFVTEAYILASEMADRIYAYVNLDDSSFNANYNGLDTNGAADPGCIAAGCNNLNQIAYDKYEWGNALSTRLPGGRGTVSWNAANSIYTITVMWDQDRTGATGIGCSGNTNVDLTCFRMEVKL